MSVYFFNPGQDSVLCKSGNVRTDWSVLGIEALDETTVKKITPADILLLHYSDMDWGCLKPDSETDIIPDENNFWDTFRTKIVDGQYRELVFFTGGGWMGDEGKRIDAKLSAACGVAIRDVVIGPGNVANSAGAVPAFSGFVKAYKSDPTCTARDFFSAYRRELEVAFRLLAQVWLVATDKSGDTKQYLSDENIREALAGKRDTVNGFIFWKPVLETVQKEKGSAATSLEHAPLDEELKRCFEKEGKCFLVGKYPDLLKGDVNRDDWIKWAFKEKEQRGS